MLSVVESSDQSRPRPTNITVPPIGHLENIFYGLAHGISLLRWWTVPDQNLGQQLRHVQEIKRPHQKSYFKIKTNTNEF